MFTKDAPSTCRATKLRITLDTAWENDNAQRSEATRRQRRGRVMAVCEHLSALENELLDRGVR
ncbi:MAG: hypothetical protein ABI551_17570, partial [Polyangiaceae bacterium]